MAKVVGLVGSASGKLGNVVYAVSNGVQVARVYQPVISNPKSSAQLLQRAKGNLIGRISAITPREAIIGLGANNRQRRAEYLRNGLSNAVAQLADGIYTAKLQPSALKFSKGSEVPVMTISSIEISTTGSVTINYNRVANVTVDEWNKSGGYWVLVAIDDVTGNYDFVRVYNWERPTYPAQATTSLSVVLGVEPVSTHDVYAYFVPFVVDPSKGSTITNSLGIDAAAYAATLGLTEAASLMKFGNSNYLGQAVPEN